MHLWNYSLHPRKTQQYQTYIRFDLKQKALKRYCEKLLIIQMEHKVTGKLAYKTWHNYDNLCYVYAFSGEENSYHTLRRTKYL